MTLTDAAKDTIQSLRDLHALTADENGAQRVAWTPIWDKAVEWFIRQAESYGATVFWDSAHNLWAKFEGISPEAIIIGSHIDSVPNGGWLDGALGVAAGLGVLKRYHEQQTRPAKTIYVVAWMDEEGARFGYSCVGSAAASGCLDLDKVKALKDNEGIELVEALKKYNISADDFPKAHEEFLEKPIQAYLELHIEQGPILEQQGKSVACLSGITGCYRQYITFEGQAAHSGSPMSMRHDSFLAAAETALASEKIALKYDGYSTVGKVSVHPDVVTIFPGQCRISLDQRSIDKSKLDTMVAEAMDACKHIAEKRGVKVTFSKIWNNNPTIFDEHLIQLCKDSIAEEIGTADCMYSGPLHDAAEIAKMVPAVMLFVASQKGLSHCKEENTSDADLTIALKSFFRLVDKVVL